MAFQVSPSLHQKRRINSSCRAMDKSPKATGRLRSIPARNIKRACSGWIATYEIWNLCGHHDLIYHFDIALEDSEVLIQTQSIFEHCHLEPDSPEIAYLRFPAAISTNLHVFAILRTIYLLHDLESLAKPHITSMVLPVFLIECAISH
jgi:hypothetical protein